MKTYALDFESHFSNEITVTELGSYGYFDALTLDQIYLVSVVADDGRYLCGHPRDLDWSFFTGSRIVVWNGSFEMQGLRRLRDLGIPIPEPAELVDAADMAAYVGLPRNLKGAAETALGVKIDKGIRDTEMKGKTWNDMDPEFRERVMEYAINDSRYTLEIWQKYEAQWPEKERLLSKLTREWASEGIGADAEAMEDAMASLKKTIWEAGNKLPWFNRDDPKSVPLSPKKLAEQCRDAGIPCPKSLAMDSEECAAWEDQYGEQYPWVGAMRDYRRANAQLKKYEALRKRTHQARVRYELKYFGAGMTGRWSGAAGANLQNMSGKPLYGTNMRESVVAPDGKLFVVSDLANIEPRCLHYIIGDTEALELLRQGVSPYLVYARKAMGLQPGETWPKSDVRYLTAKQTVLSANYATGHMRFMEMLVLKGLLEVLDAPFDREDTPERYRQYLEAVNRKEWIKKFNDADDTTKRHLQKSWEIIDTYRTANPKIVSLWRKLADMAKQAANRKEPIVVVLPSGRTLTYRDPRFRRIPPKEGGGHEVIADIMRTGRLMAARLHGGVLTENCCQAIGRDVHADCLLRLHEAGYKVALHVHDEVVIEVPEEDAEEHREKIEQLMSVSPAWAPGLPVAAEATVCKKYSEAK